MKIIDQERFRLNYLKQLFCGCEMPAKSLKCVSPNLITGLSMSNSIHTILEPDEKDLGGFQVRRLLPHENQQMVGPFIFFDHIGPAVFPPGKGLDVRPHPHINLATLTYLFEGVILHCDSLNSVQEIHPGAVN